jgi:hypothetical protein
VYWSGTGNLVAIAGEDSFYVLRFDRDAYAAYLDNGGELDDEGVEEAFELEADIADVVQTGKWIGDCFVYTTSANRLNYVVGGQTHTITHFDTCVSCPMSGRDGFSVELTRVHHCPAKCTSSATSPPTTGFTSATRTSTSTRSPSRSQS